MDDGDAAPPLRLFTAAPFANAPLVETVGADDADLLNQASEPPVKAVLAT
jgi:hypothetical protein